MPYKALFPDLCEKPVRLYQIQGILNLCKSLMFGIFLPCLSLFMDILFDAATLYP